MTSFLNWLKGILSSTFNVSVKSKKMSDNSGTVSGNKVNNRGNVDIKINEGKDQFSNNSGLLNGNSVKEMGNLILSDNSFNITNSEKIDVVQEFSNSFLKQVESIGFGDKGFFVAREVPDVDADILRLRNFVSTTLAIPNSLVSKANNIIDLLNDAYVFVSIEKPKLANMNYENSEKYSDKFNNFQVKLMELEENYLNSLRDYIYGKGS